MPTKRFCNSSVTSLQDFYENTPHETEQQENLAGILEDKEVLKADPKLFSFGLKTRAGDIKLHGVIYGLRFIASYLEEQEKIGKIQHRVGFDFQVFEVKAKPRYVFKPESEGNKE